MYRIYQTVDYESAITATRAGTLREENDSEADVELASSGLEEREPETRCGKKRVFW